MDKNKNNIFSFTKDIFADHKLAVILSSVLLIISGLLDAIGLSLIAPTVSLLINDFGSTNYDSNVISNLKKGLDFLKIPYSLRYILSLIAIIMFLRSIFIFSQSFYISIIQFHLSLNLLCNILLSLVSSLANNLSPLDDPDSFHFQPSEN